MAKTTAEAKSLIKKDVPFDPVSPNNILDLSSFEWRGKLVGVLIDAEDPQNPGVKVGEDFKRYLNLLEELCPVLGHKEHSDHLFHFELHKAKPIYQVRYSGVPNSPFDLVGIEFNSDQAKGTSFVHSTKIPVSVARTHNTQIENAHSRAGYGTFYVLSKK